MKFVLIVTLLASTHCELSFDDYSDHPEERGNLLEGDIAVSNRKNALIARNYHWPKATIPYKIEGGFTDHSHKRILEAMQVFHTLTCIRFIPKRDEHRDYVEFNTLEKGCWSFVGRQGGNQSVNFSNGCFFVLGTIMHELLHLLGFLHEQNRRDRDDYINIHWENIRPGLEANFRLQDAQLETWNLGYDYHSILHYSSLAFSFNNKPTIVPKFLQNVERKALSTRTRMLASIFFQFTLSIFVMLIFLKGYFPIKQSKATVTDPPETIGDCTLNLEELYSPTIERLVFIVIDALREDFVTFENMPYTFKKNEAIFKVKVEAPTVTLPRIKAITTGDVPQYVDIILNLGAATKCHDSFLHRAQHAGKKIVFYGDDTWLKIYPDLFLRKDGTTSFYVNDFKEVDDNVTRHIGREMKENDWDIMFLHYLGLDHIGHVRGPFSSLIKPKLREMDDVIQSINEASKSWNRTTLILVTGDHGMKDSGGHGGTTYAETHVPLITFGLPCNGNITILQTDIPATLSTLFGIQIASTNVGRIISDFFPKSNLQQLLYVAYYNVLVLLKHSYVCDNFQVAVKQHCDLLRNFNVSKAQLVFKMYEECLFNISSELMASVEQNLALLLFGLIMTSVCLLIILIQYLITNQNKKLALKNYTAASYLITIMFAFCWVYDHYLLPIMLSIFLLFFISRRLMQIVSIRHKCGGEYRTYIIFIIVHAILLLSSSFVEEEHQIWYFYTCSVSLIICYNNANIQGFLALAIILGVRMLRMLNSTGDQWASYPDLADWFLIEENFNYLQIFYVIALNFIYISLIKISLVDKIQRCLYFFSLATIFVYKIKYPHIVNFGQFTWLIICITSCREMFFKQTTTHKMTVTWILIISLLLRPYNSILISSCIGASYLFNKSIKQIDSSTIFHMWLGSTLFFCQGHSNSIASIDLAPGYIGLNNYIPLLVFSFTLFHTYAFPVLSLLLLLRKHQHAARQIFAINIINRLWILFVILIMVAIQRGHLFVWSVFAPKLLIEAVHTSVLYFEMCIYFFIVYFTN